MEIYRKKNFKRDFTQVVFLSLQPITPPALSLVIIESRFISHLNANFKAEKTSARIVLKMFRSLAMPLCMVKNMVSFVSDRLILLYLPND